MSLPPALRFLLVLVSAASAYGGTPSVAPQDSKNPVALENAVSFDLMSSHWNLNAGYQWRQLGSLNFQTGSQAARSSLPWMAGGGGSSRAGGSSTSSLGDPNAAGSSTSVGNRTYSDGYVNQDGGTPFFGDTWNWGYNNASQVQGNTLSYHNIYGTTSTTAGGTATSNSQTSSLRSDLGWSSDLSGSGWFASIGSPAIFARGPVAVNLELGYSYASADASHDSANVFTAHQTSVQRSTAGSSTTNTTTATDVYDTTGVSVPSAPYSGTFAGPGPLISNIPSSRTLSNATTTGSVSGSNRTSISTADFSSHVNESLDMKMNTISFGPHLSWESHRFVLGLSSGFALNIADWEASYQEDLSVRQNGGALSLLKRYHFDNSGTDVLPGVYIEVNANYRITKHVALFVGGRYDWAGTIHDSVGPSDFSFKASGWTAQGGFTVTF